MDDGNLSAFFSNGAAAFVLLVAAALTVPACLVLLWLYRRAVRTAMRQPGGAPGELPEGPEARPDRAPAAFQAPADELAIELIEQGTARNRPTGARPIVQPALGGPWGVALVYGASGLGYAAFTAAVWLLASGFELLPIRTLVTVWAYAWPVVLTTNLVAPGSRQWRIVGLYFAGLVALFLVGQGRLIDAPVFWSLKAGLPTVLLLAFLHGRLRPIGPLVFAFMIAGVGGAHLGTALVATDAGLHALAGLAVALGVDVGLLLLVVMLLGFGLLGVLGWRALDWLGRRYADKAISDQSLIVDSIWLSFTIYASISLASAGPGWAAATLGGFVVYKALTRAGFAVLARALGERRNHRLLLLRVFGSRARSERLMALVGSRWRHTGSIQLIVGVDLATTTLEPHEFMDFVRGQLARRYIHGRADLERQLAALDLRPDADGRFRVNEFFCRDDTWRATLSRLAASSDAVLMDLRGFSPANQGCVYELRALVDLVPLSKVVLIADGTTDEPFLRQVLGQAWAAMAPASPNRQPGPARLTVDRLARADIDAAGLLLARLGEAAETEPAGRAGAPNPMHGSLVTSGDG